jgi:hypothetical protein
MNHLALCTVLIAGAAEGRHGAHLPLAAPDHGGVRGPEGARRLALVAAGLLSGWTKQDRLGWLASSRVVSKLLTQQQARHGSWVAQAEQAEALSDEARALVEEQAGSLYGKTHNRSAMLCGCRAACSVAGSSDQVQRHHWL